MESMEALCSIAHVASEDEVRGTLQRLSSKARRRGLLACCHRAIKSNPDVGVCRAFLEQPELRQNVNKVVTKNSSLLHAAVLRGGEIVRLLLAIPEVDLNLVCGRDGLTPLHLACSLSRSDVVELLLHDRRVDLSATTLDCRTALHCACDVGFIHLLPPSTSSVVRMLVKAAATSSNTRFLLARDRRGRTALHYASENNHTAAVEELLDGCLAQDSRGRMAVHLAAQKGHREVVCLLLSHAPHTLHSQDDDALTPLHHAARGGHLHILQDWLSQSLKPKSEMFIALLRITTHHEVAMFVLKELDHQRPYAPSLLHWAVESHSAIFIPQILKWQPHLANEILDQERNQTPLHVATISGHVDVVEALCLERGWSLHANRKDKFNKTALDYAYALGHRDVCEHLLRRDDVKEYIGMLQKEHDAHVTAANAILVVAVLLVGVSYASCVKPMTTDTGSFSSFYIIVPTTFLTSIAATILGASAALPFSFGLYIGKHPGWCHSDYIGYRVRRIRVMVALASYFLLLSLATMMFSFVCSVFGMGASLRSRLLACTVFTVAFASATLLAFVTYFSRAIYYRAKQFSFRSRKSFKLPAFVKP